MLSFYLSYTLYFVLILIKTANAIFTWYTAFITGASHYFLWSRCGLPHQICNKIYYNNYSDSIYNNLIKPTIWNNSYYTCILEITNLKKNLVKYVYHGYYIYYMASFLQITSDEVKLSSSSLVTSWNKMARKVFSFKLL